MPPSPRDIQLIGYYLDGRPSAHDLAALEQRLREDAGVANVFAAIGRMDACLDAHFREEKGLRDAASVIKDIEAVRPAPALPQAAAPRWRAARVWAAAAAAVLVLLCGAGVWLYLGGAFDAENLLLEGRVLVGGVEVTRIPQGARIVVPDAATAVIRLTDGSLATFDASSEAVLRGRTTEHRQTVELVGGGGVFQVVKSGGGFEVATPLGGVTVAGTEFSVRLLPAGEREKEVARADARPGTLAVAVKSGVVNVHFGGRTYVLREGQTRRFAQGGERKARQATCSGRVTAVGPDAMTVTRKTGDERKPVDELKTFTLDAQETKVQIETDQMEALPGEGGKPAQRPKVVEGTISDLRIGQQVEVMYTVDGNKAVKVFVRRVVPPKPGGGEGDRTPRPPRTPRPEGGEGDRAPRPPSPPADGERG